MCCPTLAAANNTTTIHSWEQWPGKLDKIGEYLEQVNKVTDLSEAIDDNSTFHRGPTLLDLPVAGRSNKTNICVFFQQHEPLRR